MKNYYEILGLSKDATPDDIKKAYRQLSKKYHPDVNPEGEEMFKEIVTAHEILSDPQKKQVYDMGGDPNGKGNPFGGQGFDIDEFLRSMGFGGDPFARGGGNFRRKPTAPEKIISVDITPLESYTSASKEITYKRNCACDSCSGTGGEKQTCSTCHGQGHVTQRMGNGPFQQLIQTACPTCQGRGFFITKACFDCNATGTKPEFKTVKISIQHGVDDGEFFRLESLGDFHNGIYGNLLLKVRMVKDQVWEKNGDDLIYNNIVDFQGLQEDSFELPHPDGNISIRYPEIFDTQIPLRVRGKGYKRERVGDLYVKNVVKFKRESLKKSQDS